MMGSSLGLAIPTSAGGGNVALSIAGGPAVYYDASVPTTISIDTGVDAWTDLSGNGNHIVNTTDAEQPTYANGVVSFDGTDDVLTAPGAASLTDIMAGGGYIIFVSKLPAGAVNAPFIDKALGTGGWRLTTTSTSGVGALVDLRTGHATTDGRWISDTRIMSKSAYSIIEVYHDTDDVANNPTMTNNGVADTVTENTTPVGSPTSDSSGNLDVGGNPGSGHQEIDMKALAIYRTIPTATERASLRQDFGRKYGVATV